MSLFSDARSRRGPDGLIVAAVAAAALTTACVVASAPAVTAAPTAAPTVSSARSARSAPEAARTLDLATPVTSSTGRALTLGVTAALTATSADVTVSLATRDGAEQHAWRFRAGGDQVAIDDRGRGSVALGAIGTGGRGKVRLRFVPGGASTTHRCGGQTSAVDRPVRVSGRVAFDTQTSAWGSVGGSAGVGDFSGPAAVTWTYALDCPAASTPCRTDTAWSTYTERGPSYTAIRGSRSGARAEITALRYTSLGTPSGALRTDRVTAADVRRPVFAFPGAAARVTAYGDSGSVLVRSADTPDTATTACRGGGVQKQRTWAAEATNGSDPFALPAQLFGGFRIADGAQATLTRYQVQ